MTLSHLTDPEWVMVDWYDAVAATSIQFRTGGNGVRNYPVNSEPDMAYRLRGDVTGDAIAGAQAQLELNGGTTNQVGVRGQSTGAAMQYSATLTVIGVLLSDLTGNSRHIVEAICYNAPTGQTRFWIIERGSWGASNVTYYGSGEYRDTVTPISTIAINVTTGNVTGRWTLEVWNPQQL